MRIPGFTADASVYATGGQYWMSGASGDPSPRVTPQAIGMGGVDIGSSGTLDYSNSCRAACRCCANNNNYFCCKHCRWCSWP
jgi:hypothetical protein